MNNVDMISIDIEILKQELKELNDKQEHKIEQYKLQIKQLEGMKKKQLQKYNEEYKNIMRQNTRELARQKIELGIKKKEIDKWLNKINNKKMEID